MTAWVIAETGALVAAPTAALALSVAGARACLGAVTRVRGRQRRSLIAQPRPRADQPAFFLAAPVAAPAAELVPATTELVPDRRAGPATTELSRDCRRRAAGAPGPAARVAGAHVWRVA